jgi:Fur family ferric uptake transcriptional regulator
MAATSPSTELHELVNRRLTTDGVRYTSGRRSVVAAIQMASGPRTAAELIDGPTTSIPVSSLYRTLALLEHSDVLKKHHGPDGIARFELAEWLTGHHHHVVCVACGAIEDVTVPRPAEQALAGIVNELGAQAGFRVLDHVLEVEGVCARCDG